MFNSIRSQRARGAGLAVLATCTVLSCGERETAPTSETAGRGVASASDADSDTGAAGDVGVQGPRFREVTAASGLDFTLTSGRVPPTQILEVKGGGMALFDWNADGWLDLLVPNGASLETPLKGPGGRLFAGAGELRFTDATRAAELDWRGWSMGTAVGDVDGDGRQDVFIAAYGPNALLLNAADGTLEDQASTRGLDDAAWGTAASFGDFDIDGDLDLYVVNYLEFDAAAPPAPTEFLGLEVFGGPAGLPAQHDRLYTNDASGRFTDRSSSAGIDSVEPAHGLGVVTADFDLDGDQDIYVGNDSMANFLFANDGASDAGLAFTEIAAISGLAKNGDGQSQATMGIALCDLNDDVFPDVFTTNFARDTNTLQLSRGKALWRDTTNRFGLAASSREPVGWSAIFGDFDLDLDEDLVVVNGHVYPDSVARRLDSSRKQRPLLYERAGARFATVDASQQPWLQSPACDRGALAVDLDHDGDLDLVVAELGGPLRLLEGLGADAGARRGLSVELDWVDVGNRRGVGARIELDVASDASGATSTHRRYVISGGGYQSALEPSVHFGLGAAEPTALRVFWPDGRMDAFTDLTGDLRQRVVRASTGESRLVPLP